MEDVKIFKQSVRIRHLLLWMTGAIFMLFALLLVVVYKNMWVGVAEAMVGILYYLAAAMSEEKKEDGKQI